MQPAECPALQQPRPLLSCGVLKQGFVDAAEAGLASPWGAFQSAGKVPHGMAKTAVHPRASDKSEMMQHSPVGTLISACEAMLRWPMQARNSGQS